MNYRSVDSYYKYLIIAFVLAWFIPKPIYFSLGSLNITPQLSVGVLLFLDIIMRKRVKWSMADNLAFCLLLVNLICIAPSSSIGRALESTGRLLLDLTTTYLIARSIAQSPELMLIILRVILRCLLLLAPFLILESFCRFNIHCSIWGLAYSPHPSLRLGLTRAYGWTEHSIMLGLTYAAFLAPALTLAIDSDSDKFKNWLIFVMILSGVFLSLSTGAWSVAFFGLLLMYIDRHGNTNRKQKWRFIGLCLIAGYIAIWLFSGNNPLLVMMYHISFLSSGWLYRWQLWERVFNVMPGHWLLGYGFNVPDAFSGSVGWSIDNHYLSLLLKRGSLGLGTWLMFNFVVLKNNIKSCWIECDDLHARLLRSFGFSIIGFLFSGLTVAFFSTGAVVLFFSIGMASTPCLEKVDEDVKRK